MTVDLEVQAMAAIAEALEPLDPSTRERVLTWASARFVANPDVILLALEHVVATHKDLQAKLVAARHERDALQLELLGETSGKCGSPVAGGGICERRVDNPGGHCWQHATTQGAPGGPS